ncbi:MAG: protein kinase [Deltaproteobacteria bacterium]|nr:protein kinase [Deltaproteobacteria bacterium]
MIAAGQTIGNYRILAKIGTGGMGAVYLAEHPQIGKRIALKVIHRELAGNKDVVQRFFQEARAVNKIGNEHIVEIHDFGVTPEGDHYYIMEYLDGKTLAHVMTHERALDVMRALHIGAQIASALAAAHASGVIHRDLKPDNIMLMNRLGDQDFVKVLDFGLAKMFAASGASAVQTAVGVLLGTPQYMSPEACESKRDIDHRTDIYALGVLLFQMMTGVLPFDGETMGEVLVKQVTVLPPVPRALNPAIPPSVEQILLRCLAKPVDARFATMLALRDALLDPESYLRGSPPIAPARSVAPGEAVVDGRQMLAAADARTRMMQQGGLPLQPPGASPGDAPYGSPGTSKQIPVPGLAMPTEPKMNTMRISTPIGYSSRPPRRVWPIVLVVGLLLGLGGGAFTVAWCGRPPGSATPSTAGASSAAGVVAVVDAPAPAVAVDAGIVVVPIALAKLTLDSKPSGATVYDPNGIALGKTPLKLEWPTGTAPVTFTLKLRGYRDRAHEMTVTSNTMTQIQLDKIPRAPGPVRGSGSPDRGAGDTELERPD